MTAPLLPPIAWRTRVWSNAVRVPLFFLATGFFGSLSLAASCFEKRGRVQHGIARLWAKASLRISGARVTVVGREHIRPLAVYASNHTSFMDTPLIFSSLPFQFRILARQSLWTWPFIGWHLNRSGQIPIDEGNGSVRGLSRAMTALKSGMPLFVFPEGGRTEDGKLQPFMNGPAFMAIRARVPIIPIALVGTYELLPIHGRHFRPGPVKLIIGEPIDSDGYSIREVDRLTARLWEEIEGLYSSYAGEGKNPSHDFRGVSV